MGDMADDYTEAGEDMWFAHLSGDCLEDCIYCETEGADIRQEEEG